MADRTTATFQAGTDKYSVAIYAPSGTTTTLPAVVLLHGTDGLEGESKTEIPKLAGQIADAGFVVFLPEYFGRSEPAGLPPDAAYARRIDSVGTYAPRVSSAVDHARSDLASIATASAWWGYRLVADSPYSTRRAPRPARLTRWSTSLAISPPARTSTATQGISLRR